MIEDKIILALKDIAKLKLDLKELKKSLKQMEKIDTEDYAELKKAFKDLKAQVKDYEEKWLKELMEDNEYNNLKEMTVKKEEELAQANQQLFDQVSKLPPKPVDLKMETEEGQIRIQINPEMRVYLNGKEEKKRAA